MCAARGSVAGASLQTVALHAACLGQYRVFDCLSMRSRHLLGQAGRVSGFSQLLLQLVHLPRPVLQALQHKLAPDQ